MEVNLTPLSTLEYTNLFICHHKKGRIDTKQSNRFPNLRYFPKVGNLRLLFV